MIPTIEQIIESVAMEYQVSAQDLRDGVRSVALTDAREVATALMYDLRRMSYPEIASAVGYQSHTGAMDARKRANQKKVERVRNQLLTFAAIESRRVSGPIITDQRLQHRVRAFREQCNRIRRDMGDAEITEQDAIEAVTMNRQAICRQKYLSQVSGAGGRND